MTFLLVTTGETGGCKIQKSAALWAHRFSPPNLGQAGRPSRPSTCRQAWRGRGQMRPGWRDPTRPGCLEDPRQARCSKRLEHHFFTTSHVTWGQELEQLFGMKVLPEFLISNLRIIVCDTQENPEGKVARLLDHNAACVCVCVLGCFCLCKKEAARKTSGLGSACFDPNILLPVATPTDQSYGEIANFVRLTKYV